MKHHAPRMAGRPMAALSGEKKKKGCGCGTCPACAAAKAAEAQGMEELGHAETHGGAGVADLAGVPVHGGGAVGGAFALGMGAGREARSGEAPGGNVARDLARILGRAKDAGGEAEGRAPGTLPLHPPSRGPLDVSHPADAAEQEAERIVEALYPHGGSSGTRERSPEPKARSAGATYRRGVFGGLAEGGMALPEEIRSEMEGALGADLSGVRVHTDANAAALSESLGATAFTYGSDIFFDSGQFAPGTHEGDRLLAHELSHAIQQQNSGPTIAREGEQKTTLQCVNENLSSAGVAAWVLAIVGTTCGLIGAIAGSPTGPGAAGTAALAAATCIAGVVGFSVGFVLGIITGCAQDPNFRSAGANPR
ncbi:DUF4157 domain-containing protein [Sphingomonas parva]|uniref:DUF4157 domain-containing protein n=1 Tax=Sphingomonas parva TaxID=2555898 RepID=A0A4Y8ZLP4_9SPHN|nr:DUF4157 domain-containing protein [Sphingomonas parva]TFI56933.1 DUF4157 domain-containing protein [Sphingomonas parva]